jgi:hypothetical protein
MKLSIIDMRVVLKARTAELTGKKASEDPVELLAGVKDIRTILDEIETYATEMISTKEELANEQAADK